MTRRISLALLLVTIVAGCKANPLDPETLWARCDEAYDLGKCEVACNLGVARACTILGQQFEGGELEIADTARSLHFYERACHLGHGGACCAATFIHLKGNSSAVTSPPVPVDEKAAGYFKKRACDLGFQTCCGKLTGVDKKP